MTMLSCFEEYYRRESTGVYRYVYSLVRNPDDTLEVVQETFLNFHQLYSNNKEGEFERALLYRIARNRSIDLLRRRNTRENFLIERSNGNLIDLNDYRNRPSPEDELLIKETQRQVDQAFGQLNERDRECLALRRSGFSYKAIAEVMNINQNSISQIINRALSRFENLYKNISGIKAKDEIKSKTK